MKALLEEEIKRLIGLMKEEKEVFKLRDLALTVESLVLSVGRLEQK